MKRVALIVLLLTITACAKSAPFASVENADCSNDSCVHQLIVHYDQKDAMVSVARNDDSILAVNFKRHRRDVVQSYMNRQVVGSFYKIKVTKSGYKITYVIPQSVELRGIWQLTCSFGVTTISDLRDCGITGKIHDYYFEAELPNYRGDNIALFLHALDTALTQRVGRSH